MFFFMSLQSKRDVEMKDRKWSWDILKFFRISLFEQLSSQGVQVEGEPIFKVLFSRKKCWMVKIKLMTLHKQKLDLKNCTRTFTCSSTFFLSTKELLVTYWVLTHQFLSMILNRQLKSFPKILDIVSINF